MFAGCCFFFFLFTLLAPLTFQAEFKKREKTLEGDKVDVLQFSWTTPRGIGCHLPVSRQQMTADIPSEVRVERRSHMAAGDLRLTEKATDICLNQSERRKNPFLVDKT